MIRIGTSPMTPAQILVELWPKIHALCPEIKFQLVPFENTPENARELMHRNWSHYVDVLRDDIWQNHSQIEIVDFDFYSVDVFHWCENSNDVLMAVKAWDNVHPLLKVIPVEWSHSIPYGLLHSETPSETVKRFLSAMQTVVHQS